MSACAVTEPVDHPDFLGCVVDEVMRHDAERSADVVLFPIPDTGDKQSPPQNNYVFVTRRIAPHRTTVDDVDGGVKMLADGQLSSFTLPWSVTSVARAKTGAVAGSTVSTLETATPPAPVTTNDWSTRGRFSTT